MPPIEGIPGAVEFRTVLDVAFYRADVRKVEKTKRVRSARLPTQANSRTKGSGLNGSPLS